MKTKDVNPASEASLEEESTGAGFTPALVVRDEHAEGEIARLIEQQTAKVPSHWFLFGAFGAMGISLALELSGRSREARFVGMWPTPILVLGIYNKIVKTVGTR